MQGTVLARWPQGDLIRKAGIMAVDVCGGCVAAGDTINVKLPPKPHVPLAPV